MCARMFPLCDFLPSPIIFPQPIPNESTISKEPNTKFHENRNVPLSTMWPSSRNPACCTAHTLQSTAAASTPTYHPKSRRTRRIRPHPHTAKPPYSATQPATRRTRKIQPLCLPSKPPPSANHTSVAEHGGYNPSARPPNLHNRRTTHPSPKKEGSAITTSCRWCGRMG